MRWLAVAGVGLLTLGAVALGVRVASMASPEAVSAPTVTSSLSASSHPVTVTAEATATAAGASAECTTRFTTSDRVEPTVENTAFWAETVFVGTVSSFGDPQWTATDAPQGSPDLEGRDAPFIATPVTFSVDQAVRGSPDSRITVPVRGGVIGCDRWSFDDVPQEVSIGQRYLVFLIDETLIGAERRLIAMRSVTGDVVNTPAEGDISLSAVAAAVEAAEYRPFPTP